jgi:hypothetical protein
MSSQIVIQDKHGKKELDVMSTITSEDDQRGGPAAPDGISVSTLVRRPRGRSV